MSQETNLNVAPYFDDYDEPVIGGKANDYYKVLFKPGYPVQARELTTLQSILQNQVEQFGNHFFKEGAKVIPGDLTYIPNFYAVEVDTEFLGIPVSLYLDNLVGLKIRGEDSGVVAKVKKVLSLTESDKGTVTLYVDYFESNQTNLSSRNFNDGENLITESNITFGNSFISAGEGFARTITENSTSTGSAFAIGEGIYFLRGYFVAVDNEILILDQYTNQPSYRVGLEIIEELVSADVDPYLNDNANGFNNYAAPGADRLKITAKLAKRGLEDFETPNFVELANVKDGILRSINKNTNYNLIADEFARRTFDESGNYYVKSFDVFTKESLNDGKGNEGIYKSSQLTSSGFEPSDDLYVVKVGPGKAYVKGYETETIAPTFIDAPKPRTTDLLENQSINFNFGSTLKLNRVSGAPSIGINTSSTISLRDSRVGISSYSENGREIGIARVYDFALESGGYDTANTNLNQWDISLYDVQTYGDLSLNEAVTLTVPTRIKGDSSGATAFLRYAVSSGVALTVYQKNGDFINGEKLTFDNSTETRVSTAFTSYGLSNVQSLYANVGASKTFSADIIPSVSTRIPSGNAQMSGTTNASGTISTITSPTVAFPGIVTTGNLIQYTRDGFTTPSFAKITQVNTNSIIVTGVTTVTGVCDGGFSTSDIQLNDLSLLFTETKKTDNDENLFALLPKRNVESVDLTSSSIVLRKEYTVNITNNSTGTVNAGTNLIFLPFDEERYVLSRTDGTLEPLTEDKFDIKAGSGQLVINGLGANDTGATLVATVRKDVVTTKPKRKSTIESLIVSKSIHNYSGAGSTTINDGLTKGNYPFGTRVQDEKISLNVPDVIKIHAIYESKNASAPVTPSLVVGSLDGPTSKTDDLLIGEEFVGTISGARGIYVEQLNSSKVSFAYLNNNVFQQGEIVNFLTSGVSGVAGTLDQGSTNVTNNFKFDNGQTKTYYGYSFLTRKQNIKAPTRQLKVVFAKGYYDSSDTGDITNASSYEGFNYGKDIQSIGRVRNTDIIDVRPRVVDFTPSEGSRSPFEFVGRSFADGTHSSDHVFASDESQTINFRYYLPRIDRVFITKDGVIQLKVGEPSDNPKLPGGISDGLNIANIALPPFLYNVKDAEISFVKHKRYQMTDISNLETRIKNLEYYTSLSLLESNTSNLFVSDSQGLNRFKSGFLIDNFSSVDIQDNSLGVKNSVDLQNGQLRASHYTTQLNLEIGSDAIAGLGTTSNTSVDRNFLQNITGTNIRRTGDVISLDYTESLWLQQPFATRVENVTPYLVKDYEGTIELTPTVDVWIDVNRLELRDVMMEGSFRGVAEALRADITDQADGSRLGVSPIIWNSWETNNIRQDLGMTLDVDVNTSMSTTEGADGEQTVSSTTSVDVGGSVSLTTNLDQRRSGIQHTVREQIDTESLGDRIVSRNIIQFMRSRNIMFTSRRMKPNTQLYSFFDGVDVTDFCTPKLLEISMTEGTFQIGENVIGIMPTAQVVDGFDSSTLPYISFRVANSNHKFGPYNDPTDFFDINPYDRDNVIPATYSTTSTTLNVDTFSLSNERQPEFWGWARTGMILRGQTSGAVATVNNVRLVADRVGTMIGAFLVPDGNVPGNPSFETGRNVFRLTSSSINSRIGGVVTSSAEEIFFSQGDIDNTQEVTLSLRNARVEHEEFEQTRTLTASSTATANAGSTSTSSTTVRAVQQNITNVTNNITQVRRDPLAQSFYVDDETGIFVTSLNVYFRTKDDSLPVYCQLREIQVGMPTLKILPFSEVELTPEKVNVSDDGTAVTTFTFDSPVYLNGLREYAIVLLSDSTEYTAWISRLGEADVTSAASEAGQVFVSAQPVLGSLFKSQNASSWDASQYEDLKFDLYRADFVETGSVQFFNPKLPTNGLSNLRNNPFDVDSKTIRVGLGTTVNDSDLTVGNTITQLTSGATGNFVGSAGTIATLSITNPGLGYTPASGGTTYNNLTLTNVTGTGRNGLANITINGGVAVGATISDGGIGYSVGDLLTVSNIGVSSVGRNLRLSVGSISGANELIINDVQGDFTVGAGGTLTFVNNSGLSTDLNSAANGNVIITSTPQVVTDGLHFRVNHRNHGMHSDVNKVVITGAKSDVAPTTLSVDYSSSSTSSISVGSTANFTSFEGVSVGSTNPGYAIINDEIIKYTGHSDNTLTGITRAINGTKAFPYSSGNLVYKYEMNNVSLLRINKTHTLSDASIADQIGLDHYNLKIDVSSGDDTTDRTGASFPKLFFRESDFFGGGDVEATYNVPFEIITPKLEVINPKLTTLSAAARTISGQSIDGAETPYVDKGFQAVSLNNNNFFSSPRVVASQVNEDARLPNLPGKKSFSMNCDLLSADSRLSPCIDLTRSSIIFTSNRVNAPISNYITDSRANTIDNDPNAFYYVSKPVSLENSATALKIILTGAINEANDIRAFFALQNDINETPIFAPFPGYNNLTNNLDTIDPSNSDGTTDTLLVKNTFYDYTPGPRSFKELTFTADNLPSFKIFRVKLVLTSTNQAIVPVIQDLRAIALA